MLTLSDTQYRWYVCHIGQDPRLCDDYRAADMENKGDSMVIGIVDLPDGGKRAEVDQFYNRGGFFRIEATDVEDQELLTLMKKALAEEANLRFSGTTE